MSGTIENIFDEVRQLNQKLDMLPGLLQTASQQINVVALSDITGQLGLIRAGEFRTGNNRDPGDSFSGMRLGFPGFYYPDTSTESSDLYNLVGVDVDTLMVGIRASDGVLIAGGGAVELLSSGIILIDGIDSDHANLRWFESTDLADTTITQPIGNLTVENLSVSATTSDDKNLFGLFDVFAYDTDPPVLGDPAATAVLRIGSVHARHLDTLNGFELFEDQISLEIGATPSTSELNQVSAFSLEAQRFKVGDTASTDFQDGTFHIMQIRSTDNLGRRIMTVGRNPNIFLTNGFDWQWMDAGAPSSNMWYMDVQNASIYWGGSDTTAFQLGWLAESALTLNSTATAGIEDPDNEMGKLWLDTNSELRLTDSGGTDWNLWRGGDTNPFSTETTGLVLNEAAADQDFRIEGQTDPNLLFLDAGNNDIYIGTAGVGGDASNFFISAATVFNDGAANRDFRFEGQTDANLLFTDASANRVGIGTATPGYKLDVSSTIRSQTTDGGYGFVLGPGGTDKWGLLSEITTFSFNIREVGVAHRLTILTGGNVGIGTETPSGKLHVFSGIGGSSVTPILYLSNDATDPQDFLSIEDIGASPQQALIVKGSGNVGIGTATPNANIILDVVSTTKAFRPPVMTTAQRDLIASPQNGMIVWNSTTGQLEDYNGGWAAV